MRTTFEWTTYNRSNPIDQMASTSNAELARELFTVWERFIYGNSQTVQGSVRWSDAPVLGCVPGFGLESDAGSEVGCAFIRSSVDLGAFDRSQSRIWDWPTIEDLRVPLERLG